MKRGREDNQSVLVIVANIKQYRIAFYTRLAARLSASGIYLRVAYSEPEGAEALKGDSVELPAPLGLKVKRWYLIGGRVLAQWVPLAQLRRADLIIMVQSNGYLLDYPLLLASSLGLKRVAYWGHGYNHQARANSIGERFRRRFIGLSDWWFAYTQRTADYLVANAVSAARITVINNAIDTAGFAAQVAAVTADEVQALCARLALPDRARIALYCGSLYGHKHIPFLLDAGAQIHAQLPNFILAVAGAGPDAQLLRDASDRLPWLRYLGAQFGHTKAVLFRSAEIFLNPGLVGLAILDSFAAGLPFITSDLPIHSPEIAYLEPGVNGLVLPYAAAPWSQAVIALLGDGSALAAMGRAAVASSRTYTLEKMAENVARGIEQCLGIAVPLRPADAAK